MSEQYQTDVEPGDQEAFEEMMARRHQLNKTGSVQVPAVPGQQIQMVKSPQANRSQFQTMQLDPNEEYLASGLSLGGPPYPMG